MNKPVIIDGCNVAECQQLVIKKSGKHYCYDYFNGFCEDNKDRYRKALEEAREITEKYYLPDKKLLATGIGINPYGAIIEIQDKVNEVLKDE